VPVIGQQGGDPGAIAFDAVAAAQARGIDVLIADTAGRLPTQLHLMERNQEGQAVIAKAMPGAPHEPAGARRRHRAERDRASEGLRRRARAHRPGADQAGRQRERRRDPRHRRQRPIPLLFIGVGEGIDDLQPFVAASSSRRCLISFAAVGKRYPAARKR
jgi:fused signal recognition particle receptor